MNKITKFLLLFSLSQVFLLAADQQSQIDLAGLNDMQRFYYQQGAEDTRRLSFQDGYNKATQDFEVMLQTYASKIKEYEAGKYLVKEAKITYPRAFRIQTKDGYKVEIESPTVEREFTEKDLFILPLRAYSASSSAASANEDQDISPSFSSNGFSIPARDDTTKNRDSAPDVRKEKMIAHIPYKNEGIQQAIAGYNIEYASTKNGYDLYFNNEKEKTDFCVKVTGNAKCALE